MSNERLRAAIASAGMSLQEFSERVAVDPKTVQRWIDRDRTPHRRHRMSAAALLGKSDGFLWPATYSDGRAQSATQAELVRLYPSRGAVGTDTWCALIDQAIESIDLLAYAASFLHDSVPDFGQRLSARAAHGVRVRLLFGDPASEAVSVRGEEEGIGDLLAGRCRLTWNYFGAIVESGEAEGRRHGTTLYASLFRFDDVLMANVHAYGVSASRSPVLHINRIPGGRLFSHYMDSFERVWLGADAV